MAPAALALCRFEAAGKLRQDGFHLRFQHERGVAQDHAAAVEHRRLLRLADFDLDAGEVADAAILQTALEAGDLCGVFQRIPEGEPETVSGWSLPKQVISFPQSEPVTIVLRNS